MGTHAAVVFVVDGVEKTFRLSYYDGWPSHVGLKLLEYLKVTDLDELRCLAAELIVGDREVLDTAPPEMDGDLGSILEHGIAEDWDEFGEVDWYYMIHLDAGTLTVPAARRTRTWDLANLPGPEEFAALSR